MPNPIETSTTLAIEAFGVVLELTANDVTLIDEVTQRFPPGWSPIESRDLHRRYAVDCVDAGGYAVTINDGEPIAFTRREAMLDFLEGDVQIHVAEFATPHLFVHAGVVAWNGTAILLPGRSFAGKSTLVTSLVKAGATYYSDEYAVLDAEGRVLPYPRRVSLRTGPHGPEGRLDLTDHAPTGDDARTPIPVGLVALLRYEAHAGWDVRELAYLRAIMALSEQTVAIQRRAADAMKILKQVAHSARVIQGTRGDADDAVERILAHEALWTHGTGLYR